MGREVSDEPIVVIKFAAKDARGDTNRGENSKPAAGMLEAKGGTYYRSELTRIVRERWPLPNFGTPFSDSIPS
jgi:hypothetical protein